MKTTNYLLTISISLLICACNSEDIVEQVENKDFISHENVITDIMSFDNKDAFTKALDNYDITKGHGTRATGSFYSADDIYNNSSGEDAEIEKIGFLVPDEKFRHFLNKNLEIIVNDTLYRITKDGTFFAHLSDKEELEKAVKRVGDFTRTANDLKELGNVRLKNTFNTWDGDSLNPINDENYFDEESDDVIIPNNQSMTRAAAHRDITRKDIEKFPTVGAVNVHIKDKILRFSPNYLGHKKIRFNSNSRRKLYVSLYRYDYVFGVSIGIDCKVMKKLWHGLSWGRMVHWDDGIYYGISSLIVKQQVKRSIFEDFMKSHRNEFLDQWKKVSNNHFTNYADATKDFKGGIVNNWSPEYNKNQADSKYVIPIIGEGVSKLLGNSKNTEIIAKELDRFLVKEGIGFISNLHVKKAGKQIKLFSEKESSIFNFFSNDITWNGGGYRVRDTFLRYYKNFILNISVNSGKFKPGVSINDNDFLSAPEIYFCEGIVYTRDGNGWIGAKILQK